MKRYCYNCDKEVDIKIVTKKESYNVYGESIEVNAQVLVCCECGEEFFCEKLDDASLNQVYNEYRRRHNLPASEDIKWRNMNGEE